LIELMIVVAIVGILSSIASSFYQDYVVRAKTTEILLTAGAYKTDISTAIMATGEVPTWPEINNPTKLIRRIEFWRPRDDRLVIHLYPTREYWSEIDENVDAILMEVIVQADGRQQWSCGPHATFRKVPERFLPSTCRDWIDNAP